MSSNQDESKCESKGSCVDGEATSLNQECKDAQAKKVYPEDIGPVSETANNYLLDLEGGQRTTELNAEQSGYYDLQDARFKHSIFKIDRGPRQTDHVFGSGCVQASEKHGDTEKSH